MRISVQCKAFFSTAASAVWNVLFYISSWQVKGVQDEKIFNFVTKKIEEITREKECVNQEEVEKWKKGRWINGKHSLTLSADLYTHQDALWVDCHGLGLHITDNWP